MQIDDQNFPSLIIHSIFVIILISCATTSFCAEDAQFSNCNTRFSCGQSFPSITYPFWGEYRPQECGLPGFEVKCQESNHLTIDIGSQTFRILSLEANNKLRIARNDLWFEICPKKYENTTIDESPFHYGADSENITLFYDCDGYNDITLVENQFSCGSSNASRKGFFADDSVSSIDGCELNISVPVLSGELEQFRNRASSSLVTVQELLNQGFRVEYNINSLTCTECATSLGLCWSGTNSTQPTCLCRDGPHNSTCPSDRRLLAAPFPSSPSDRVRGPSAAPSPQPQRNNLPVKLKNHPGKLMIGLIIGLIVAGLVICAICVSCNWRKLQSGKHAFFIFMRKSKDCQNLEAYVTQFGSLAPRRYTYKDIKKMTNSFKDKIGKGGFGDVYRGNLFDNRRVAVKILNSFKGSGEDFINEIASISRTSHVNVVTLLGFCLDGERRALVYEFMPNGSLEKYIYGETKSGNHLGLLKLYDIAVGIARGLEYLHKGCNTRIFHFDIKPHNILLDEDFCPKISDFGLAKLCTQKESIITITGARGTVGYIAPELVCRNFGVVSHKSDIYSYGMMLLEMIGGRKNFNAGVSHTSEIYFPHWAYHRMVLDEDLKLQGVFTPEENEIARKMILVGLWCIQNDPSQRPTVSKVIEMLEGNLQALEIPPKPFFDSPSRSPTNSSSSTSVVELS